MYIKGFEKPSSGYATVIKVQLIQVLTLFCLTAWAAYFLQPVSRPL